MRAEDRRIEAAIWRLVRDKDPAKLTDSGLFFVRDEIKDLLDRIDKRRSTLHKTGRIASWASNAADAGTLISFGAWAAALLGFPAAVPLAMITQFSTPAGVAYKVVDRTRKYIRRRAQKRIEAWYQQVARYSRAIDFEVKNRFKSGR